jgi:hypothetical protein
LSRLAAPRETRDNLANGLAFIVARQHHRDFKIFENTV